MLLTLYYATSTWVQWWRISSTCKTFRQLLNERATIVLFEQRISFKDVKTNDIVSTKNVCLRGVTSSYCLNAKDAHVLDVLRCVGNKRECSIFPSQDVDVSSWINFPDKTTSFPIHTEKKNLILDTDSKIHVLVEASFKFLPTDASHYACQLTNFGIPKVWTAGRYFALILETDIEHFYKLSDLFLNSKLSISEMMEIIRLETVGVRGVPYDLVDSFNIPVTTCHINMAIANMQNTDGIESDDSGVYDYVSKPDKIVFRYMSDISNSSSGVHDVVALSIFENMFLKKSNKSFDLSNSLDCIDGKTDQSFEQSVDDGISEMNNCTDEKFGSTHCFSEDTFTSLIAQHGSTNCSSNTSQFSTETVIPESPFDIPLINSIDEDVIDNMIPWKNRSYGSLLSSDSILPEHIKKNKPVRHSGELKTGKPPNVIIYSESPSSVENVKIALSFTLHRHRYTIYSLTLNEMLESPWLDQASLVVVCGNVPANLKPLLMLYLLKHGGKLLCLCSDLLELFLPSFKTAEVKPDEVVNFSYGKWEHISLLHHIFCYQPSPRSTKFSMDESPNSNVPSTNMPSSVELYDDEKKPYELKVNVLAAEKTWQTPTLLLATETKTDAKALFSQVHLELDPDRREEVKGTNLRLEILADLLSRHLGLHCTLEQPSDIYVPAYFLGRHEVKLEFLRKLYEETKQENVLKTKSINIQFCGAGVDPPEATAHLLPVMTFNCPQTFSTVEYFENLKTKDLGRLVIYADVITSSMHVFSGPILEHGFVTIPRQQTGGIGRGKNSWISPDGCAMFTIQIHIPLKSYLGERLSLIQHIVALAIVSALCNQPGYETLNLGLKWPNDIYAGGNVKIGGLIVISCITGDLAVCNIGVGVNLNNSLPTTCINDLLKDIMQSSSDIKLPLLSAEKYFALVFNELEKLLNTAQSGNFDLIFELYYSYWLHSYAEVLVINPDNISQKVTIIGLDDYGFLKVRNEAGSVFSVHPDGNSFNMLAGLIVPKLKNISVMAYSEEGSFYVLNLNLFRALLKMKNELKPLYGKGTF